MQATLAAAKAHQGKTMTVVQIAGQLRVGKGEARRWLKARNVHHVPGKRGQYAESDFLAALLGSIHTSAGE